MTFDDSIYNCFSKYAVFSGRAPRSEYWYFHLFIFLGTLLLGVVDNVFFKEVDVLDGAFGLVTLLPSLAVLVRRLHDKDRSGWWVFIGFVPLVGWLLIMIWICRRGTAGPNRFGPDPLAPASVPEGIAQA